MILSIIGGSAFVVAMLLLIAADNRVDDAKAAEVSADRKVWLARELAIAAGIDPYTIGLPDEDVDDDAPAEVSDPVEEPMPPRPAGYRRRHGMVEIRAPFDIADGWDPVAQVPRPELPPVAAGVVTAEGGETEAEFAARIDAELDALFAKITVGAR